MIREAYAFAVKAHQGELRKGSEIPYIYHPMAVALEVSLMTSDEDVIAAAYLHDVLEDTPVTAEELGAVFGEHILGLVMDMSEDKSKTWEERKIAAIEYTKTAPREVKLLMLADKFCNLRDTARDFLAMGDKVWQRFNEKRPERQRWYVAGILNSLADLSDEPAYKKMLVLYDLVFQDQKGDKDGTW